jgi:hypothetical protein
MMQIIRTSLQMRMLKLSQNYLRITALEVELRLMVIWLEVEKDPSRTMNRSQEAMQKARG